MVFPRSTRWQATPHRPNMYRYAAQCLVMPLRTTESRYRRRPTSTSTMPRDTMYRDLALHDHGQLLWPRYHTVIFRRTMAQAPSPKTATSPIPLVWLALCSTTGQRQRHASAVAWVARGCRRSARKAGRQVKPFHEKNAHQCNSRRGVACCHR